MAKELKQENLAQRVTWQETNKVSYARHITFERTGIESRVSSWSKYPLYPTFTFTNIGIKIFLEKKS